MAEAGKGYLVRDAETADGKGGKVDQLYPYTLRGLTEALEEARFRSHSGAPQVLAVLGVGNTRIIRRFERGREVPVPPLAESPVAVSDRRRRLPRAVRRSPSGGRRSRRPSAVTGARRRGQ